MTDQNLILYGITVSGSIQSVGANTIQLENSTLLANVTNNSTQLEIADGQIGRISGTFTNNGNLQVASSSFVTTLRLSGDVTFTGTGTVTLGPNSGNEIGGSVGTELLTNAAGHTIRDGGNLPTSARSRTTDL